MLNDLSHYLLLSGPVGSHDKQQRIFRMIIILTSILGLQDIAVKRFCGTIVLKRGVAYFTMPLRLVSFPLFTTYSQKWIAVARAASLAALITVQRISITRSLLRLLRLKLVCWRGFLQPLLKSTDRGAA